MGFKKAKFLLIQALESGNFDHEVRNDIDDKNLLSSGDVSADEVLDVVKRCNGSHHTMSPHHFIEDVEVHIFRRDGVIFPFFRVLSCRIYAAVLSFMVGVIPPMPIFGRSLL